MRLFSFFLPKTIAKENSPLNGQIEVIEQFGKRAIRVEGLEQSGPMVEKIWEKGIKQCNSVTRQQCNNVLILGLGGGSVVKIINKHFSSARILGIEIDPIMIELGKRYLGLKEYQNLKIKIADAFKWIEKLSHPEFSSGSQRVKIPKQVRNDDYCRFDLILVDLYVGRKTPQDIKNLVFLKKIKTLLSQNGTVIFNFLRTKEKKLEFKQFLDKLKKMYHHIKVIKPVANYLIICQ